MRMFVKKSITDARRWTGFWRNDAASTSVEMALVATPFLALIVAGIQLGLVYLSQAALEVATEKSARLVLTGTEQAAGTTQQQFLAVVCSKLPSILSNCSNLLVDAQVYSAFSSANTSTPTITYNANGTVSNQWQYNIGGSNSIVVMRVMYLLPVVSALTFGIVNQQNNRHLLIATAVFKNEPY